MIYIHAILSIIPPRIQLETGLCAIRRETQWSFQSTRSVQVCFCRLATCTTVNLTLFCWSCRLDRTLNCEYRIYFINVSAITSIYWIAIRPIALITEYTVWRKAFAPLNLELYRKQWAHIDSIICVIYSWPHTSTINIITWLAILLSVWNWAKRICWCITTVWF